MSAAASGSGVSAELMRLVNRQFITGVTVVTVMDGSTPRGLAVNSYASVSLEPPTAIVCVNKRASAYAALFASHEVAVNILAADQLPVALRFSAPVADRFAETDWHPGANGAPVILGCAGHLELEIRERVQASTHTILVGRVSAAAVGDLPPLLYGAGDFYDATGLRGIAR